MVGLGPLQKRKEPQNIHLRGWPRGAVRRPPAPLGLGLWGSRACAPCIPSAEPPNAAYSLTAFVMS